MTNKEFIEMTFIDLDKAQVREYDEDYVRGFDLKGIANYAHRWVDEYSVAINGGVTLYHFGRKPLCIMNYKSLMMCEDFGPWEEIIEVIERDFMLIDYRKVKEMEAKE